VEQTTGRDRVNIHGAINLETGRTQILDVERIDGPSLISSQGRSTARNPGCAASTSFSTTPLIIAAASSKNGLQGPGANVCCTSDTRTILESSLRAKNFGTDSI
jgi:hypothetical protein